MDNQREPFRIQPGDGKSYTMDEYLALIVPRFREHRATICQCITGLTEYAAQLAAQHQEDELPRLRQLCIEIAEFWRLTDDGASKGHQAITEQYGGAFDHAVSTAREFGQAPEMDERTQQNVLEGLAFYAKALWVNNDGQEAWAIECDSLAESLKEQWQLEDAPQQTSPAIEGMRL